MQWRNRSAIDLTTCIHSCTIFIVVNCTEGDIRLVGGANDYEGRVEVCHLSVWGTVCDTLWDDREGVVACRQLGRTFVRVNLAATYGERTEPVWLDFLNCRGSETQLINCRHYGFGVHDCLRSDYAGVVCGSK